MTIKQQINHASIQKVFHLHNGVSHAIHLCHTLSILQSLPSLCYSLKITNYGIREKTTFCIYVMRCAILSHLYNLKSVKNTPSWVFFTFFTLYKCYQIAQRTIYSCFGISCYIIIVIIINDLFQFWLMTNST